MTINKTAAIVAAIAAGLALAGAGIALADDNVSAIADVLDHVCDNQAVWASRFEWIASALGIPVGASLLANLRGYLPAPLQKVLDALALNWKKAEPIVVAIAEDAAKAAPKAVALLAVLAGLGLSACASGPASAWTPVAAADVEVNAAIGVEVYLLQYEAENPSAVPLVRTIGQGLGAAVAQIAMNQAAGATASTTTIAAAVATVIAAAPGLKTLPTAKLSASGAPLAVADDIGQLLIVDATYVVPAASAAGSGTITAATLSFDLAALSSAAAKL